MSFVLLKFDVRQDRRQDQMVYSQGGMVGVSPGRSEIRVEIEAVAESYDDVKEMVAAQVDGGGPRWFSIVMGGGSSGEESPDQVDFLKQTIRRLENENTTLRARLASRVESSTSIGVASVATIRQGEVVEIRMENGVPKVAPAGPGLLAMETLEGRKYLDMNTGMVSDDPGGTQPTTGPRSLANLYPCTGVVDEDVTLSGGRGIARVRVGEWKVGADVFERFREGESVWLERDDVAAARPRASRIPDVSARDNWMSGAEKIAAVLGVPLAEAEAQLARITASGALGEALESVSTRGVAFAVRVGEREQVAVSEGRIERGDEVRVQIRPGMAIRWAASSTGRKPPPKKNPAPKPPARPGRFGNIEDFGDED